MPVTIATPAHLEGMLALQEANLAANLSEAERRDGFLSARFSAADFSRMGKEAAVLVAEEEGRVVGYVCSATVEDSLQVPILAALIAEFPRLTLNGRRLHTQSVVIYGPVCVAREARGKGVFRALVEGLKTRLAGRHDAAVAFIASDNPRSLAAHVDGLGMALLGNYSFRDRDYSIIAFAIQSTSPRPQ